MRRASRCGEHGAHLAGMAGTSSAIMSRDVIMASVVIADCASEVFAANRAVGRIALSVKTIAGATRRARVHEVGPLRVRCPGPAAAELEAVIVNTAGGM